MAFTLSRLGAIRRALRRLRKARDGGGYTTHYTKPEVDAVLQALEARLSGARSVLNSDIEGTAPGIFTGSDKVFLVAEAMQEFMLRELGRLRR